MAKRSAQEANRVDDDGQRASVVEDSPADGADPGEPGGEDGEDVERMLKAMFWRMMRRVRRLRSTISGIRDPNAMFGQILVLPPAGKRQIVRLGR